MSIKNKFVTAITTAGLLAGLFGSAFVPSVSARVVDTDESYAFLENEGNAGEGYINEHADDEDKGDDLGRIQIHSWSIYGTPGEARVGEDDFTNARDMSIGFYIADADGFPYESVDLDATVSGGKVKVAFAYNNDNQSFASKCHDEDIESHFGSSDSVDDVESDGEGWLNEGYYYLCIKPVGKNTLGTSTITVKANGVTIYSKTVQVIGDLEDLELSVTNGYNRVSANNAEYGDFFTVIGKDNAGQIINKVGDGYYNDLEDWTDGILEQDEYEVENVDGDAINFFYDLNLSSGEEGEDGVGLAANVCVDGDEGESYDAVLQLENYDGDEIESNDVTLVCTGDADDYVITASGVTQEYQNPILFGAADWSESTQGEDDVTGSIELYVVIKDQDGALMGVDGSTGFGLNFSFDGNGDLGLFEDDTNAIGAGGKLVIGGYDPNMDTAAKYEIEVTIVNPDTEAADEDDLVKSLYYQVSSLDLDYTLTRVRNAAKTRATWTADWGLDCSNAIVYFDWVNKNGTKGTLVNGASPVSRRANFDGVATFTLKKRNMTIFVTAYACDDFGDTPDELGPVKARFR